MSMSMSILEIQNAIMSHGWRFTETTFNDGSGETYIEFSKTTHASGYIGLGCRNEEGRPADSVGWGRYPRQEAWDKAYAYIINGVTN